MTNEQLAREIEALRTSLESLRERVKSTEAKSADEEPFEVAEKSFEALLATKDHLQDSSSRILAAIAFLTTAAAAIYREARLIHERNPCLEQWATLWFGTYVLCVSVGALCLLGSLWSPLWEGGPGDRSSHSLMFFRSASVKPAMTFDELREAYEKERDPLIKEGKAVSRLFHWGGAWLCSAFFFFLALTANLFATSDASSTIPLLLTVGILGFVIYHGYEVRHGNPDIRLMSVRSFFKKQSNGWPILWQALVIISAFLLMVVLIAFRGHDTQNGWCPGWDRPAATANADGASS